MNNESNIITVESEALELKNSLTSLVITDQITYNRAVQARVDAKAWLKSAEAYFDGLVKPAYESYKNLLAAKKQVIEPVEGMVANVNRGLLAWDQAQEALRRAEQAKLEQEARERAEAERIAQAEALQAQGVGAEVIDAMLDEPVIVTEIAVAQPTYDKSSAVQYRDNWSAECTDLLKFVKHVAKNPSLIGLLSVNQPALNAMARSLKDTMNFPGVEARNNKVVASGR